MDRRWSKLKYFVLSQNETFGKYMGLIEMKYKVIWRNTCGIHCSQLSPSILKLLLTYSMMQSPS
jgi:hypothetical protein